MTLLTISPFCAYKLHSKRRTTRKLFQPLVLALLCLSISSCSTISFSRKDAVFDGTHHAASALVCSGYWSNRTWERQSRHRSFPARTGPTLGLIFYSLVDVSFSVVGDIVAFVPNAIIRGGPARAAFDVQDHAQPWQCGSLQHSMHTIGAM